MSEIPKHIIETQILTKVPPECLPIFQSVCKSFNSFISNPEFISGRLIILNITGDGFHVFDLDALESPPFFLRFPFILPEPQRHQVHVFGSCNGLLCFRPKRNELVLLNPLTGVFVFVNIPHPLILDYFPHVRRNYFGFGFDSLSNDFKIVQIANTYDSWNVSVYRLRTNSWNVNVSSTPSQRRFEIHGDGALIETYLLHWIIIDNRRPIQGGSQIGTINKIGCFDLRTEEWIDNVVLPRDYDETMGCHRQHETLGVFDGCLCLLAPSRLESHLSRVDMWVMKEYGVEDSWVKVLGLSDSGVTSTLRMCPLGSSHGSIIDPNPNPRHAILLARGMKHTPVHMERVVLIWYNLKDKRSRLSEVHKVHGFAHHFFDVCVSTKSLISLPGGSRIQKEKRTSEENESTS